MLEFKLSSFFIATLCENVRISQCCQHYDFVEDLANHFLLWLMIACVCLCVFISNAFLQTNFISSLLAGYCGLWRNSDCLHVDLLMNFCFIVAQHVLLTLTQFLDTNLHLSFVISGYVPSYLFSFLIWTDRASDIWYPRVFQNKSQWMLHAKHHLCIGHLRL